MSEFELPPGWTWVKIDDTGEYINGFAFKPSHRDASGRPIIRIQNLTNESKPLNRTSIEVSDDYEVLPGDILVSWSATLDVFIWRREKALLNQHIFKVVPNSKIVDKGLLFHWLKLAIEQLLATEHLHGSTMKHINRGPFLAHKVPLPPLNEQTRIASKLEELLTDLDAGVADLKIAQKKLGQYRQSLLKAAVEGALTEQWRKQNTPTETGAKLLERILAERRTRWEAKQLAKFKEQVKALPKDWKDKYPEPVQPNTANLPTLPDGWIWTSVDCLLADIETGKSFKCIERPPTSSEVGVVKVSAVSWGEYDERESKTCTNDERINADLYVKKGDFLFSRANTVELVGACVISQRVNLNVMLSDKILRFILVQDDLKPWLLYLLRSKIGRKQIEAMASGNQESMKNIGQARIRSIAIPVGPISEIEYAMNLVADGLAVANQQIIDNDVALRRTIAQRKNILKKAFLGQLVAQDSNDEPASILLERIRANRLFQNKKPKKSKAKNESSSMKKTNFELIHEWILSQENKEFTFAEMRASFSIDYEILKNVVFQLLGDKNPTIEQVFSKKGGSIKFRRIES